MSVPAIAWASRIPDIGPTEKFVLVALADYIYKEEVVCFPSVATLERWTNLSNRTIRAAIKRLAEQKLLTVLPRRRENGSFTSSRYSLSLPEVLPTGGGNSQRQELPEAQIQTAASGTSRRRQKVSRTQIQPAAAPADPDPVLIEPLSRISNKIPSTLDHQRTKKKRSPERMTPEERLKAILEDADFMTHLVEEYGDGLGGRAAVVKCIRDALNHTSSLRWVNDKVGVSRWLDRQIEWGRTKGAQPRPTGTRNIPGGARHPFPEKYRGMSSSPPRPPPGPPLSPGRPGDRHLVHTSNEEEEQP